MHQIKAFAARSLHFSLSLLNRQFPIANASSSRSYGGAIPHLCLPFQLHPSVSLLNFFPSAFPNLLLPWRLSQATSPLPLPSSLRRPQAFCCRCRYQESRRRSQGYFQCRRRRHADPRRRWSVHTLSIALLPHRIVVGFS